MENNTSKMVALLAKIQKEQNGAILDTLRYYGRDYGLKYGVALHTLKDIASSVEKNTDFAKYLYRQQVRELKLLALMIADPKEIKITDFDFWAEGIINSEVAEVAAHYLFSKADKKAIEALSDHWVKTLLGNILLSYTVLLSIAGRKDFTKDDVEIGSYIFNTVHALFLGGMESRLIIHALSCLFVSLDNCDHDLMEELIGNLNAVSGEEWYAEHNIHISIENEIYRSALEEYAWQCGYEIVSNNHTFYLKPKQ